MVQFKKYWRKPVLGPPLPINEKTASQRKRKETISCWPTASHICEKMRKLLLLNTLWWKFTWNIPIDWNRIIPFLTYSCFESSRLNTYSIGLNPNNWNVISLKVWPWRQSANGLVKSKFFKQHDGYFICEVEKEGGSSCRAKMLVSQGQVTNKMRHSMRIFENKQLASLTFRSAIEEETWRNRVHFGCEPRP